MEGGENPKNGESRGESKERTLITQEFSDAVLKALEDEGYIEVNWSHEGMPRPFSFNPGTRRRYKILDLEPHATRKFFAAVNHLLKYRIPSLKDEREEVVIGATLITLAESNVHEMVREYLNVMPIISLNPEVFASYLIEGNDLPQDIRSVTDYLTEQRAVYDTSQLKNREVANAAKGFLAIAESFAALGRYDLIMKCLMSSTGKRFSDVFRARGPELMGATDSPINNLRTFFEEKVLIPAFKAGKEKQVFDGMKHGSLLSAMDGFVTIPRLIRAADAFERYDNLISYLNYHVNNGGKYYRLDGGPLATLSAFERMLTAGSEKDSGAWIGTLWRAFTSEESSAPIIGRLRKHGLSRLAIKEWSHFNSDLTSCFDDVLKNKADVNWLASMVVSVALSQRGKTLIPDVTGLIDRIIATGNDATILTLTKSIPTVSMHKEDKDVYWKERTSSLRLSNSVARRIGQLGIEHALDIAYHLDESVVNSFIENLADKDLAIVAEKLSNLAHLNRSVAIHLTRKGFSLEVLRNIKSFDSLSDRDIHEILEISMSKERNFQWRTAVASVLFRFKDGTLKLPVQLFEILVEPESDNFARVVENLEAFDWSKESRKQEIGKNFATLVALSGLYDLVVKVEKFFKIREQSYHLFADEFGVNISTHEDYLFDIVAALYYDKFEHIKEYRVRKAVSENVTGRGKQGVHEFFALYRSVRTELVNGTLTSTKRLSNPLVKLLIKHIVRFGDSQWDDGDSEEHYKAIIREFLEGRDMLPYGRRAKLKATYGSAANIKDESIRKRGTSKNRSFTSTFLERWKFFRQAVSYGYLAWRETKTTNETTMFESLLRAIETKKQALLESLIGQESQYSSSNHPNKEKILFNIRMRITTLGAISTSKEMSAASLPETMNALALFGSEFAPETVSLLTYFALMMHPSSVETGILPSELNENEPSIEQVSWMIDFLNHVVGTETVGTLFSDTDARRSFASFIKSGALEEGLKDSAPGSGSMKLSFVADQGLLMKFSGHIGDACWVSENTNNHPNIFTVAMIQNRGATNERFVGSALMIEATARDHTRLLIIRGLNPRENVITQLDVNDFMDKFLQYAKGLAAASHRDLAIVIDAESGDAGTNRPLIQKYMENMKGSLRQVRLASTRKTTFNDYPIMHGTYYV